MPEAAVQLNAYLVEVAPRSGLQVFMNGDPRYVDVLRRAFPEAAMYGRYDVFRVGYDHLVYVHNVRQGQLEDFLGFCCEAILLSTTLDECWAMSHHTTLSLRRTEVGNRVYAAKTYPDKPGDPGAAFALGELLASQFGRHPRLHSAARVVGVPSNPPKTPYNLPEILARAIAERCAVPFDGELVVKTAPTAKMKDGMPDDEKLELLRAAYEVRTRLDGETIVVVDDLLRSGTTLGVVAQALRQAGAREVLGVVATRTLRS